MDEAQMKAEVKRYNLLAIRADAARYRAEYDLEASRALCEKYREALNYITSPTMGRPSGVDAYDFAAEGATEQAARYALQICIRTARAALGMPWHA